MNFLELKKLNRRIPGRLKSNSVFNYFYRKFVYSVKDYRKELIINIDLIHKKHTELNVEMLRRDMIDSFIDSSFNPFEYRCYHFYDKTKSERKDYLARFESWSLLRNPRTNALPDDKFMRFELFSQFFNRDVLLLKFVDESSEQIMFESFRKKHNEAIIKPLHGSKGKGVQKIILGSFSDYHHFKREINTPCLMEQVIVQGKELAVFHPESINTVRMVTCINKKGDFSILWTLFRTGCGGSVVDNVGAGGIISLIDSNGIIISEGMRADSYYDVHPDTKVKFKGYPIPMWSNLCRLAEKAHRSMPNQCVFGWDFAWSESGWNLVEVNSSPAPDSFQILSNSGIRPIFSAAGIL